jgi:hypothetical protein
VAASQGDADGAKTRLREALEESIRDDDWSYLINSLACDEEATGGGVDGDDPTQRQLS